MNSNRPVSEDTGGIVVAALALWAVAVLSAGASGVFTKLAAEEVLALGIFATAFAVGTYVLDAEVRAFIEGLPALRWIAAALGAGVAIDAAFLLRAGWEASLGALPHSAALLFMLPLAVAATAAAIFASPAKLSSARAKSPAATSAAT